MVHDKQSNLHWNKEKVVFKDRLPLKTGSSHMKFSMTEQENATF